MRYHCFVTDYDGTLATNGQAPAAAIAALKKLKATGRKIILVTGRQLDELKAVFPEYAIFDRVVAENGALLYCPSASATKLLGTPLPEIFGQLLKDRQVPFSAGHVIVATWEPHHHTVLEVIRETGAEYQLIFNKGAVMILPPGINKATGLREALNELGYSAHNAVAIGDAENDTAMLQAVECAVAVSDALPMAGTIADWMTTRPCSEGVIELIERLISDDLAGLDERLRRHYIKMGKDTDGCDVTIGPYGNNILLAGPSGFGKTTFSTAFIEKLISKQYQFCLIDPEGDYHDLNGAICIGNSDQQPIIEEVTGLLIRPEVNVTVCTLAIPPDERPEFFKNLLAQIIALRVRTGRPHFLVLDEAHHLMPAGYAACYYDLPENFNNFLAVTTQPGLLCADFVKRINMALFMAGAPVDAKRALSDLAGKTLNFPDSSVFQKGDMFFWQKGDPNVRLIKGDMPERILMRHKRKYAAGDMRENSFFFTGPSRRLNLKANNLVMFIQMARGIDDETWRYHLQRHDYSNWFRNSVKDEKLAADTELIEARNINCEASRLAVFEAIFDRYTASAS